MHLTLYFIFLKHNYSKNIQKFPDNDIKYYLRLQSKTITIIGTILRILLFYRFLIIDHTEKKGSYYEMNENLKKYRGKRAPVRQTCIAHTFSRTPICCFSLSCEFPSFFGKIPYNLWKLKTHRFYSD